LGGVIHADDVHRHRDAMAAHLKGDRDYHSAEFRMRRKDGAWSWMCVRGPGIRGADGRVRRVACAASDITERKAFEYARVDAEKRARQAQNRLADAINVYADGFACSIPVTGLNCPTNSSLPLSDRAPAGLPKALDIRN